MLRSMDSVLKLLTPRSVNGCLTMAPSDEMNEVVDLDKEVNYKIIPGRQSAFYTRSFFEISLWKMERAGTTTDYKTCILFTA